MIVVKMIAILYCLIFVGGSMMEMLSDESQLPAKADVFYFLGGVLTIIAILY